MTRIILSSLRSFCERRPPGLRDFLRVPSLPKMTCLVRHKSSHKIRSANINGEKIEWLFYYEKKTVQTTTWYKDLLTTILVYDCQFYVWRRLASIEIKCLHYIVSIFVEKLKHSFKFCCCYLCRPFGVMEFFLNENETVDGLLLLGVIKIQS